jgi:hypothetical protein
VGQKACFEKLVTDVPALFTSPLFYLVNKYIPAPAMPDRFADVPFPFRQARYFVKDYAMVEPRYLCSNLLHELKIAPGFGKFCAYISGS